MFATPCIYMQSGLGTGSRLYYVLPWNPAYGLITNFRQAMLGGVIDWYSLAVSGVVGGILLLTGCLYLRRVESDFADII
jgi:lipopolysaccharide transport system permease protein